MFNRYMVLDTETTGLLPRNTELSDDTLPLFPRLVELAYGIFEMDGRLVLLRDRYVVPEDFVIPDEATRIHSITNARAAAQGWKLGEVLDTLELDVAEHGIECWVGFNLEYDLAVLQSEHMRLKRDWTEPFQADVMLLADEWAACRRSDGSRKYPKLTELHAKLFPGETYQAHAAGADVWTTHRCFQELMIRGII